MVGIVTDLDPYIWYWTINGDTSRYWSGEKEDWVTDLPKEANVSDINSEENLTKLLRAYSLVGPNGPPPYIISKDAIWRRATQDEVIAMDAELMGQPIVVRRIYDGATHISSDDALFALLVYTITQLFGEDRAVELLAPST